MDRGNWASHLCETEAIEIGQCLLYVLHDISRLDLDPSAAGMHAVIHGHTHQPSDELQNGVRFEPRQCNPSPPQRTAFAHEALYHGHGSSPGAYSPGVKLKTEEVDG